MRSAINDCVVAVYQFNYRSTTGHINHGIASGLGLGRGGGVLSASAVDYITVSTAWTASTAMTEY